MTVTKSPDFLLDRTRKILKSGIMKIVQRGKNMFAFNMLGLWGN